MVFKAGIGLDARPGLSRRRVLQLGGLAAIGFKLANGGGTQAAAASGAGRRGRAKACIVLNLTGAPSQHDTWDPKPDAPAEIRGDFKPIASSVPGLMVCELMPRIAQLAHHCCVLRAVTTGDSAHGSSMYYVYTGNPHVPMNTEGVKPGRPNDQPHFGSVIRYLREREQGATALPAFFTLPELLSGNDFAVPPGQDAGMLGRQVDPWLLSCDPSSPSFQVPGLALPDGLSGQRLAGRESFLARLNGQAGFDILTYNRHTARAFDLLLGSTAAARAFDLSREDAKVRDRYGRHKFGQSVLLARRLIEAGAAVVNVNWPREPNDRMTNNPCWDTHSNHHARMKDVLMPQLDQTFSALLEDLLARGMLDETLIVWMGEFGRTPRVNGVGGRDHWGGVFSLALAGGGVAGGNVIGASDSIGAKPKEGRVLPPDFLATIYAALGYPLSAEFHDLEGRAHPISRGEVIPGVF